MLRRAGLGLFVGALLCASSLATAGPADGAHPMFRESVSSVEFNKLRKRLLRNVRRALPDDGHLVLAEPMAGVAGAEAMGDAYFGFYLLAMGRGRPRTAERLGEMLEAAGFEQVRRLPGRLPIQAGVISARCRRA